MNKIIFFHTNVNGDCFLSRILVNQIINSTKHMNIEYFYTAPRAFTSHCLDLNIPDSNFNVIEVKDTSNHHYIIDDNLYIKVCIAIEIVGKIECAFCMKGVIENYNSLIKKLNSVYNFNILLIDVNLNNSPYIPFNFTHYDDNIFIKEYIQTQKNKYEKIVLICNNNPTTFISLIGISRKYLFYITKKYSNYRAIPRRIWSRQC